MGEFQRQREWPILIKIAREYNLDPQEVIMLLAIRDAEAGPKGYEFGVKAAKGSNLETQARWAAGSIRANRTRYNQLLQEGVFRGTRRAVALSGTNTVDPLGAVFIEPPDFVDFMAYYGSPTGMGWAPIHDPNMPEKEKNLNLNWATNVRSLMEKYNKQFKAKGVIE